MSRHHQFRSHVTYMRRRHDGDNCPVGELFRHLNIGIDVTIYTKWNTFFDTFPLQHFCNNVFMSVSLKFASLKHHSTFSESFLALSRHRKLLHPWGQKRTTSVMLSCYPLNMLLPKLRAACYCNCSDPELALCLPPYRLPQCTAFPCEGFTSEFCRSELHHTIHALYPLQCKMRNSAVMLRHMIHHLWSAMSCLVCWLFLWVCRLAV